MRIGSFVVSVQAGCFDIEAVPIATETSVQVEMECAYRQFWQLSKWPHFKRVSGPNWDACGFRFSPVFNLPLRQAVVGAGCLARRILDEAAWQSVSTLVFKLCTNFIDVQIRQSQQPEVCLRYTWDEYCQLQSPEELKGSVEELCPDLIENLYSACFGRFGLVSRTIAHQFKQNPHKENMGKLRWA